ncbi:hypothetical protein [Paraglaciecola aestuariivivens]
MLDKQQNSSYTVAVDLLVDEIAGTKDVSNEQLPSLFQQAAQYFQEEPAKRLKLAELKAQMDELKISIQSSSEKTAMALRQQLNTLSNQLKSEQLSQQKQRLARLNSVTDLCRQLLALTEGDNYEETQLLSAKFLTTLVLFSPEQGKRQAELHQKLKPAYKAVLSLRLLDQLLRSEVVKNPYILKHYQAEHRYQQQDFAKESFIQAVVLPIIIAAMFQDVGLLHPELVNILYGKEKDQDPYRLLEKDEREKMLRLSYEYTVDYLKNGLGCQILTSGTPEEREAFSLAEQKRLQFQLGLVQDASSSKLGTSEIIKIPQIYTSVIFSTKRDYQRKELPTAAILLAQLAIKKAISSQISKAFLDIVGQFPLGYGVAYIAQDLNGEELEFYEYGIVSRLNPQKFDEPICRLVTKNLIYLPHGKTTVIKKERNLHFQEARKKLIKVDPKRLAKIMQKLSHSYVEGKTPAIIPYFWEPHNFFFVEGHQNLWSMVK